MVLCADGRGLILGNGSQVYLVADLVTQNFKFRRNEERRTKLE